MATDRFSLPPDKKSILSLFPLKSSYKAAAAISFDYETSAPYGNIANLYSKIRGRFLHTVNKIYPARRDLSFCYGLGYSMRHGADNAIRILRKHKVHATWFCTGHVLLKDNSDGRAFRIDKALPYATKEAGFTDMFTWRKDKSILFYEPYSDYKRYPYWYFGDQAEELKSMGEDIQCHTFSHPYVALEPAENLRIEMENWQHVAERNGFKKARIFAFPFGGDAYRHYPALNLKTRFSKEIEGHDFSIVPLAEEILDILKDNGIELVTRCASKAKERQSTFSVYNNSKLHYMSDIPIDTANFDPASVDGIINGIIEGGCAADFWLHPTNVFSKEETENFETLVRLLSERSKKGELWLATISEIWDHFKKVKHCELNITTPREDEYRVVIINKNNSEIEGLALKTTGRGLHVTSRDDIIEQHDGGLLVKKLSPGESYGFTCRTKG